MTTTVHVSLKYGNACIFYSYDVTTDVYTTFGYFFDITKKRNDILLQFTYFSQKYQRENGFGCIYIFVTRKKN